MNNTSQEAVNNEDIWEGMQTISGDYEPSRFAKRDRLGNLVDHDQKSRSHKATLGKKSLGKEEKDRNNES